MILGEIIYGSYRSVERERPEKIDNILDLVAFEINNNPQVAQDIMFVCVSKGIDPASEISGASWIYSKDSGTRKMEQSPRFYFGEPIILAKDLWEDEDGIISEIYLVAREGEGKRIKYREAITIQIGKERTYISANRGETSSLIPIDTFTFIGCLKMFKECIDQRRMIAKFSVESGNTTMFVDVGNNNISIGYNGASAKISTEIIQMLSKLREENLHEIMTFRFDAE